MGLFNGGHAPSDPEPQAAPQEGEVLDDSLEAPQEPAGVASEDESPEAEQLEEPVEAVEPEAPEVSDPPVVLADPKDQLDDRYQGDASVRVAAIEHGEAVPAPQQVTEVVDNGGIKTHPADLLADVNAARGISI